MKFSVVYQKKIKVKTGGKKLGFLTVLFHINSVQFFYKADCVLIYARFCFCSGRIKFVAVCFGGVAGSFVFIVLFFVL